MHKDQVNANLNDLNETMPTKADKKDLEDLEARIKASLDDILKQLIELIPNKDEIANKFAAINRRLKDLNAQAANLSNM